MAKLSPFRLFRTKLIFCGACKKRVDASVGVTIERQRPPQAGDITLCSYCFRWNTFQPDLSLTLSTPDEIARVDPAMREIAKRLARRARSGEN